MKTLPYSILGALAVWACGGGDFSAANGGTGGSASGGTASGGVANTGGTGSNGSTGGAGGGTSSDGSTGCTDEDGDGESTCDGDCDDRDPTRNTGAREICGDARDNNCDSQTDELCGGLGTFVSAMVGNDANPGTTVSPVRTIAAGIANALTIATNTGATGANVPDVYVAQGNYPEKVSVSVDGVSLLGGFLCGTLPCAWSRDSNANVSLIQNTDFEGVLVGHNVTRETLIDGFTIQGLSGDTQTGAIAPGTAALTIIGGAPTISRNVIQGGNATTGTWQYGNAVGVAILSMPGANTSGPLIVGNEITGGTSTTGASIGLAFSGRPGSSGVTYGTITTNVITGGTGSSSFGVAAGGTDPSVTLYKNTISGGAATAAASWAIEIGGAITIDSNAINATGTPTCAAGVGSGVWCGGIRSWSSTSIITNNVVLGAAAALSAGVSLNEAEQPAGAVVLNGNHIFGGASNVALSVSTAIRLSGPCGGCGTNAFVGKIRNNILVPGVALARFGVYEDPILIVPPATTPTPRTEHPVALENNVFFIANPGVADALYRFHDGTNATLITTLLQVNALGTVNAGITAGANLEGNPGMDSQLHLTAGSICIDKGTPTEAPSTDFEGDTRPQGAGIDIGADEYN